MTATTAPRPLTPIREWAASMGIPVSTALQHARHGQLDGTDDQHPCAQQDERGRWWVAPDAYTRVIEAAPAPADEQLVKTVRAEVAKAFGAVLAQLQAD